MRLSISSSDSQLQIRSEMPSGEIGQGLERPVPDIAWLRMILVVASATLILLVAWEFEMRSLGLRPGDLDDDRGDWAVERRKVDTGQRDSVVLIGDSRMLFDTDLDTWRRLTGRRPIQLGLMGSNAQPILHDLAADEHFAGLLVIGTAEMSYFGDDGNAADVLEYVKKESPSQRIGSKIYRRLSRCFAFLDSNYTFFTVLERHEFPERKGVDGPYLDVWKVGESYDDRQSYLWEQIEKNKYLREHARSIWMEVFAGPPVKPGDVDRVISDTRSDIERIRARGGEVVWIRPPSSGPLLDIERIRYPRSEVWDRLMRETSSFGVHFEDYPTMRSLRCSDWSHLNRTSATAYSDAYVSVLHEHVKWLRTRYNAGNLSRVTMPKP